MTDTNEPLPGFGEIPESAQDWAKQDAAQIAAAQQGRYKDTNEPPAFGPQRNAALAELMGAKRYALTDVGPHLYRLLTPFQAEVTADYPGFYCEADFDALPMESSLMYATDYCFSHAACFGLLVRLNALNWIVGITCAMYASAACTINTTLRSEIEPCDYLSFFAQSELEEEADALRDAITAAAWQALTAQKEAKNE